MSPDKCWWWTTGSLSEGALISPVAIPRLHRFVKWVSYSRVPFISRVFSGAPPLLLEADPVLQERIIAECERRVYGAEGLHAYEQREPVRWRRLTRRSLAQYHGQRAQTPSRLVLAARSVLFAAAFPLLAAFLFVRTLRGRSLPPDPAPASTVVILWAERLRKFVWPGMFGDSGFVLHTEQSVHLGRAELAFLIRVLRECPSILAHPPLLCNLMRWLAHYGFVARHFRPARVAHFFENTASASLMTAFLAERGILHCNIQHGEIVMNAFCAFAEFDEFRVWGRQFSRLIARQHNRAVVDVVGVPLHRKLFHQVRPALQPRPRRVLIIDPFLHAMFWDPRPYFARLLRALDDTWEVRIRRHPADLQPELALVTEWNSDPELIRRGIRVVEEPPHEASIQDAIGRSRVVAGVSSAALLESWIGGCKVVYVPGGPSRASVLDRHAGSPNVCYLDDSVDIGQFVSGPATLDDLERSRINDLTLVEE
jgi:hypothetical protein